MGIAKQIAATKPGLKTRLRMAQMDLTPEQYIQKALVQGAMVGVIFALIAFMFIQRDNGSLFTVILVGVATFFLVYFLSMKRVDAQVSKRAKEIDKDVLFAGRFLLIKLNAGRPLMVALTEASKSYGVANKVFTDIIHEIDLGTPMEDALENATKYNASAKLRRILFQISNALKIGIDVSTTLESVLDEIASEQLVEIQRYGKKLNSFTMFYMLLAIVLPSLGMTIFIVVASLTSVSVGPLLFFVVGFFFLIVQIIFITLFRSIRPNVNL